MSQPQSSFTMNVQGHLVPLTYGVQLNPSHLPMLQPATPGGPVAQVNANPNDATQLGLQNLTAAAWTAWMPDGTQRIIQPGQTMRLADGATLQCGSIQCGIRASAAAQAVPPSPASPFPPLPFPQAVQAPGNPPPPITPQTKPLPSPGGLLGGNSVGISQLVPILSKSNQPMLRRVLVPGLVTMAFVSLLFNSRGGLYIAVLGGYLLLAAFYAVCLLCGKTKPWWALLAVAFAEVVLMIVITSTPLWFETPRNLFGFIIVGLREEALKALPVFGAIFLATKLAPPRGEAFAVREPLDGILLAAVSATAFTAVETLGQYVPNAIREGGEAFGVELLIPRVLGDIGGHIAYSGYFGYFIGLAALSPKHRIQFLLTGYLTAAALHAVWDTFAGMNPLVSMVIGGASFAFLVAAILKARQLSPSNLPNFLTRNANKP